MRKFKLLAFGLAVLTAGPALAGLEICNQSDQRQSVAIGHKQGDGWVSEGWWLIEPGKCSTPVKGDLKNRYYYYRATVPSGSFEDEGFYFCTQSEPFTIEGQDGCTARGFRREGFRKIDTGQTATHFTLTLLSQAEAAPVEDTGGPNAKVRYSSLSQGQFGEPFSERVIFQGCDAIDGLESCAFHANGWKYYAFYDDPTPHGFLVELEDIALNMPMAVSGDIVSYGDSSVTISLSRVELLPASDSYAVYRDAVQGSWASTDDPAYTLFVYGSELHEYYNGEYTGTQYIDFRNECSELPGVGPVMLQRPQMDPESLCYLIENISNGWLEIVLLGNANTLRFRKTD